VGRKEPAGKSRKGRQGGRENIRKGKERKNAYFQITRRIGIRILQKKKGERLGGGGKRGKATKQVKKKKRFKYIGLENFQWK